MTAKTNQWKSSAARKVEQSGKRVPIRRNGRIVAAVVSAEDLQMLEEMDRRDLRLARQAIAKMRSKKEKPIPWTEARKLLDLD